MKKYWNKFKHWLIKKLGGHVMPIIQPKIEYRYASPSVLVVHKDVDFDFIYRDMVFAENQIKRALAEEIAKKLLEGHLLEIVTEDDLVYLKRRYKARLMFYAEKGANDERD